MTKFGPPTKVMWGDVELTGTTEIEIGSMEPPDFCPSPLAPDGEVGATYELPYNAAVNPLALTNWLLDLLERWRRGE